MFIEQSVNWFGLGKKLAETDKDVIFETVTIFFILFDTVTKVSEIHMYPNRANFLPFLNNRVSGLAYTRVY